MKNPTRLGGLLDRIRLEIERVLELWVFFDGDKNKDVKKSTPYFNRLSNEEKIRVVSDLSPSIFEQKQEHLPLFPLLSKIQQDISKHEAMAIGNKLMECGLDETYAGLFASYVKKHTRQ